ncbi:MULTISPECIES: XdhC/CoxI family protein [unclassified Streptomyces]|uniref:XdhC family protein n=1 Tax=unclassified Streptomyces TaxID=2593676 RepID=UPI00344608A7
MRDILPALHGWYAAGSPFGLATVVAVGGSAPRDPGAAMAVGPGGEVVGSVSGGCVEGAVLELAREVISSGEARLETFGYSAEDAFAVGLTCGGEITVLVRRVSASDDRAIPAVARSVATGRRVTLATVLDGPAPRGATLAVRPRADGSGDERVPPAAGAAAPFGALPCPAGGGSDGDGAADGAGTDGPAGATGADGPAGGSDVDGPAEGSGTGTDGSADATGTDGPAEGTGTGMDGAAGGTGADGPGCAVFGSLGVAGVDRAVVADVCGGAARGFTGQRHYGPGGERCADDVTVFLHSFAPPPRMLIFGAVDYAAAVARVGAFLGYRVTVCDARPDFAAPRRFPGDVEVVVDWPHRYLSGTTTDEHTVVCVLTHDPKFDVPLLEEALRRPAAYIGAMGSRRTHEDRLERLREAGVPESGLSRLRSPVGLDLGARTPEEVAVSVAAEIVAVRRGGSGAPLTSRSGTIHPR